MEDTTDYLSPPCFAPYWRHLLHGRPLRAFSTPRAHHHDHLRGCGIYRYWRVPFDHPTPLIRSVVRLLLFCRADFLQPATAHIPADSQRARLLYAGSAKSLSFSTLVDGLDRSTPDLTSTGHLRDRAVRWILLSQVRVVMDALQLEDVA